MTSGLSFDTYATKVAGYSWSKGLELGLGYILAIYSVVCRH